MQLSLPVRVGGSVETKIDERQRKREKVDCCTLLEALSKSGALVLERAELHLLAASTHYLDRTLLESAFSGTDEGPGDPMTLVEK